MICLEKLMNEAEVSVLSLRKGLYKYQMLSGVRLALCLASWMCSCNSHQQFSFFQPERFPASNFKYGVFFFHPPTRGLHNTPGQWWRFALLSFRRRCPEVSIDNRHVTSLWKGFLMKPLTKSIEQQNQQLLRSTDFFKLAADLWILVTRYLVAGGVSSYLCGPLLVRSSIIPGDLQWHHGILLWPGAVGSGRKIMWDALNTNRWCAAAWDLISTYIYIYNYMIIYMIYYLVDCRLDPRNWDRK